MKCTGSHSFIDLETNSHKERLTAFYALFLHSVPLERSQSCRKGDLGYGTLCWWTNTLSDRSCGYVWLPTSLQLLRQTENQQVTSRAAVHLSEASCTLAVAWGGSPVVKSGLQGGMRQSWWPATKESPSSLPFWPHQVLWNYREYLPIFSGRFH